VPIVQTACAKELVRLLRERVSGKTASHCIFTAEYLSSFAPKLGVTNDQAVTAGLMHDLWKGADEEAYLAEAAKYGIAPNDAQKQKPKLLHGPIAAEECRRKLGIDDPAIYEAIYWHTTGRPGLGTLGLALYVADFAEPTRTMAEAAEARTMLRKAGFNPTLRYVAEQKILHIRKKTSVDPVSEEFYAWVQTLES